MSFLEKILIDKNTRFLVFLFIFFFFALIFLTLNEDTNSKDNKKRYRDYIYYH